MEDIFYYRGEWLTQEEIDQLPVEEPKIIKPKEPKITISWTSQIDGVVYTTPFNPKCHVGLHKYIEDPTYTVTKYNTDGSTEILKPGYAR